jgi:Arc/MetJ-type ribon-helix-helix transcriptional regulator
MQMGHRKRAVISADANALAEVEHLVRRGRYATVSEFVRAAVAEKLERERAQRLADQVAEYVRAGHADEDLDLVEAQAIGPLPRQRPKGRGRRAKG